MIVRGWHFACDTDEDAVLATLYYPGDERRLKDARLTGLVPPLEVEAPWPVVIMLPGINVAPDGYRWLAHRLVAEGLCVVTYAAIGSLGPAGRGITPGIDLSALTPEAIGTRPSSTVLEPLLAFLEESGQPGGSSRTDSSGSGGSAGSDDSLGSGGSPGPSALDGNPVAGLLDLDNVVVGGHSAGGTVALHNSDPAWVPGLQAVFTYAAHTMVATALGHDQDTVAAVPGKVPLMLLAGSDDGVIANSRDRYRTDGVITNSRDRYRTDGDTGLHDPVRKTFETDGDTGLHDPVRKTFETDGDTGLHDPVRKTFETDGDTGLHDPVRKTFEEAFERGDEDSWFVEIVDVGHFAICRPVDTTSGRSFLEPEPTNTDPVTQELIGNLIAAFVAVTLGRDRPSRIEELVEHPAVKRWNRH